MTSDDDWIVVTMARGGHVKHVRRSAFVSFGSDEEGARPFSYITIGSRSITVKESEAELRRLLRVGA